MASRRPTHNFVTSPSGLIYPIVTDDPVNDRTDIAHDIAVATTDGYVLTTEAGEAVWAPPSGGDGGGVEIIDYVTRTTDLSITGTAVGSQTTVLTGTSQAYSNVLHRLEFFCGGVSGTGTNWFVIVTLFEDGSNIGRFGFAGSPSGNTFIPLHCVRYHTPSSGTHQYVVQAYKSGTVSLLAGSGASDTNPPMFLRIFTGL